MERAIIVRGRLTDGRHLELSEDVADVTGEVEVILRSATHDSGEDVLDLIAALPGGGRSKEDIDRQIRDERDWGERDK